MEPEHDRPSVLAVVVATDGAPTLVRTLAGLAAQDYARFEVVGVDNGSRDDSRQLLQVALGPDRVLVADRDLGFGGAVDLALESALAVGHGLVLLVHDDLELRPDTVSRLVAAFELDERLAVAGCKLVEWDDPRQLQAVGMSVDITGRADSGIDDDEIDQGQHDEVGEVLYVSTAGMMVDRAVFDALGRFDVRYHLFRDDLDLCWRAHLAGHGVEVVTDAVALHDASASSYRRLGQTALLGPRYFAERNTLASLLKNYGALRLALVLPLFLLVGAAKVAGFVATRRLSDAWQTLRAWVWNVLHLRETRRLRRAVQAQRVRTDGELQPMFGRVGPRVRAYAEALGDVVTGGSDQIEPSMPDPSQAEVPSLLESVRRTLSRSPIGVAALLLAALGVVVALPLLDGGALRGGELAAWPEGTSTLFGQYLRPWTLTDVPGAAAPNATLPLFGLVSLVAGGSAWAAPRLLVLAIVPVAWFAALGAGRLVTSRRLPRVAGATLYALSPPVLAAVRTGQVRAALLAVLLPLGAITAARALGQRVPVDRAWRAVALLAVLVAALVVVEPLFVAVPLAGAAVVLILQVVPVLAGRLSWRVALDTLARMASAFGGALLLLLPAPPSVDLAPLLATAGDTAPWRLLLLSPDLPGFTAPLAGLGLLAGALLGLVLVEDRLQSIVGVLWLALLSGVGLAWWLVRLGADAPLWPGTALLPAALAGAVLLVVAFSAAPNVLGAFGFGWRQLATAASTVVIVVGVGAAAIASVTAPWEAYERDVVALPAFIGTEPTGVGPFRVLVLADDGGVVQWQLTDADGPSVATLSIGLPEDAEARLADVVADVLGDADPDAAARLGPLGIRYVVVGAQGRTDRLQSVLRDQLDLTPQPVAEGLVLRVDSWLPRFSSVPGDVVGELVERGVLPRATLAVPLAEDGRVPAGNVLVEADVSPGPWQVQADGVALEPVQAGPVLTWEVPPDAVVQVVPARRTERLLRVASQGALLLVALSLSLRAPRFARRRAVLP